MSGDTKITSPRPRDATPRSELWIYLLAAVSYILVGFPRKEIFAWWWFGAAWFVAVVWLTPKIVDRFRGAEADTGDTAEAAPEAPIEGER